MFEWKKTKEAAANKKSSTSTEMISMVSSKTNEKNVARKLKFFRKYQLELKEYRDELKILLDGLIQEVKEKDEDFKNAEKWLAANTDDSGREHVMKTKQLVTPYHLSNKETMKSKQQELVDLDKELIDLQKKIEALQKQLSEASTNPEEKSTLQFP